MEKPTFKLVGSPCGQHGQYTFYKALRITGIGEERIIAIGDFFFVRIWQDSELVSIGELQLLWTDRVSDQTLVSLRLYFLPENTPEGRNQHGEDEVLAINDKVVLKAEDLLSWLCVGLGWRWGLRAVWRGDCAPPAAPPASEPLHHTSLDFSDVDTERSAIVDDDSPAVMVFSYPRYCRYRALLARLEGIRGDWLRDSLVAALGGYAAPTRNTRILYCKDTFEYPELEGHEFVCSHLAPKLKGRPRGRRRRPPRSRSHSRSGRSSASETADATPQTPRRLSLRNGPEKQSDEEEEEREDGDRKREDDAENKAFVQQLKQFYKERSEPFKAANPFKDMSLRNLYMRVRRLGGYETVCLHKLWRRVVTDQPARCRSHYERTLLPYENHERRKLSYPTTNGKIEPRTIDTIDVSDSPLRDIDYTPQLPEKRLRTPSPKPPPKVKIDSETGESKVNSYADELNREFLDSLNCDKEKPLISVKPVEKLIAPKCDKDLAKHNLIESSKLVGDNSERSGFLSELAQKLSLGNLESLKCEQNALSGLSGLTDKYAVNGHATDQKTHRPAGRSSLRAVRVKPVRQTPASTPPNLQLRADSSSSPLPPAGGSGPPAGRDPPGAPPVGPGGPPLTNFGIHHPPPVQAQSDDDIVEVPYKPKSPEIIDLDEYPESPQSIKKKKLDILKERGLEVTPLPPAPPIIHPLVTHAHLLRMYHVLPQHYTNGHPPKVIQGTSIFGNQGPEKTVYGNPKDPFMPPPHVLHGTPIKPQRNISQTPQDILDLSKNEPAVEISVTTPSPSKPSPKNYTLVDGKAVVGSNLEITLVNPKTPPKTQSKRFKRSSNGQFVSCKTPTPPKEKFSPSPKPAIVIPNYQIREDVSPTSSTGSKDSQTNIQTNMLQMMKNQNLAQMMELQKNSMPISPYMDPMYMSALYNNLAGMDQRQLAVYRDLFNFRGYSGILNLGVASTPTTKN